MVLAFASTTDHSPEAALVLVVVDLVPRHGHFAALVAHDWLVSAHLPVVAEVTEVNRLPAFVRAWSISHGAVLLDVWLKLVQWNVGLCTAIGAPECRILQYLLREEVDVVGLA